VSGSPSDEGRFELAGDLEFEHVGTMRCAERLLIADVEYAPPRFAGAMQGKVSLAAVVAVVPGLWQVLVALERGEPRFLILSHDRELDNPAPLDQAEAIALIRVDSGRITVLDAELRDDPDIQTALLEAPREQVPCMLRPPPPPAGSGADPRGALLDIDAGGVFELYAGPGHPRTAMFLAITND
jgi:hypothetical protein